jgi:hypothetical protein
MFQRNSQEGTVVTVVVDGQPVCGRLGDSVAALLLANGQAACRKTAVSGAERGPYCMMGVCFDCLVTIDGLGNRQGCMTLLREGMHIETNLGKMEIGA